MSEVFRNASLPVSERVEDLLSQMTLDEKLAQLGCVWSTQLAEDGVFSEAKARGLLAHGTGQVTRIGGSTGLRPAELAAYANRIQRWLVECTRLGIPALVHEESTAGFLARDATQFPQAIGLASTWDPERIERVGAVIREQMLAVGARQTLAPVLDVARDPRWGRTEETYGEDPYLTSRIGVAYVRGVQGDDLSRGVAATGKHFLGYGLSEGGLNHAPAHIGPRELREVHARPFAAVISEAGLAAVMNAYNEVDGLACAGSKEILDDLLRGELDFDGLVVADYFAIRLLETFHRVAADAAEAGHRALEAGLDVELPQTSCYGAPLRERVDRGVTPEAWVDRSVRRHLNLKFELGLFERPYVDEGAVASFFQTPAQRDLARDVARRSIVLLENRGSLLPLDPGLSRIALVGPCVDDPRLMQGDYSYPAHLEIVYKRGEAEESNIAPRPDESSFAAGPFYGPHVTWLDGVRSAVSNPDAVEFAPGCAIDGDDERGFPAAIAAAERAEVAIVAVGGKSGLLPDCTSGEFRDASDLSLTGVQQRLVEAVVATGTATVVVLMGGRPFALPWVAEHATALLEAWLPGQEGGAALADVLFGAAEPGGRLPVSLPRSVGQVPVYYGHKSGGGRSQMLGDYTDGSTRPLYPFGHGLGYGCFEYGELAIEPLRAGPRESIRIALDVTNSGNRDAEEVVQLYVRDVVASVTRPVQQLVGFVRVPIPAGQTRHVGCTLDPSQLAFYDRSMSLVVEPGEFLAMVGASSDDPRVEGRFHIQGERRSLRAPDLVATRADVR